MPIKYKDLPFRIIASLLAAHFIVMYGVKVSFFQVLVKPMYWIALLASAIIAFILMSFVRVVNIRLDRKYDWEKKRLERVLMQSFVGFAIPAIVAFLLAFAYFFIRGTDIFETLYLRIDYPVILLLLIVLNAYYFAYYITVKLKHTTEAIADNLTQRQETEGKRTFLVSKGPKNIPVVLDNIAYFFREGSYNLLRTFDGHDYAVNQSLDEIEELINSQDFFRANRQMLVSRKACKNFESLEHNKLELFTIPAYKQQVVISQLKNRSFKEWIKDK